MLNDITVVQSALSAFNNAALLAPAFLWSALLAIPLFYIVYFCAPQITSYLKWNRENFLGRTTVWTAILTMLWVVLFGGNYSVLRDNLSVLPMVTATIVFLCSLFVSSHILPHSLPHRRGIFWFCTMVFIAALALSDTHAWWGPLLQVGAFLLGVGLGYISHGKMRPIAGTILIIMMVTVAIIMQPEFFRFGQLGSLTLAHLLFVLLIGISAVATLATTNIKPSGKISMGIYIKLKWLMRVICTLGAALFILTEGVPVFIGTLVAVFISFGMSVWHSPAISEHFGDKLFAILLTTFGIVTTMPTISALGILYWANIPPVDFWGAARRLL